MPPDGESSDDVKQSIRMTADRILAMPTKELGERMGQIASELRRRAAMQGPGFAYVSFMAESELWRVPEGSAGA